MRFWFFTAIFLYWSIQSVAQNLKSYQKDNLFGLADQSGNHITEALYSAIQVGSDYSIVKIWNKAQALFLSGTIDSNGKVIIEPTFTDLKRDGLRLIACKKVASSFRYGLLQTNGREIIPITFSSIESLGSMRYKVENAEGKFAIYNDSGENLTGFTLENLVEIKPNLIRFSQNNLLGLLDRQGNIIKEARYTHFALLQDKIVASLPRQWELISLHDFKTTTFAAEQIRFTEDGNLILQKETNSTQLFSKSFVSLSDTYQSIKPSAISTILYAKHAGKTQLLSSKGLLLTDAKGDSIIAEKNFAFIYRNNSWQVYTYSNQTFTSNRYESIRKLKNYFVGEKQNYEGLLDENGEEIIPCVYDSIVSSEQNLIVVKIKNLYGIIDDNENWLLPPQPYPVKIVNHRLYIVEEGGLKYFKNFDHRVVYFTINPIKIYADYVEETTSRGGKWKIDQFGVVISLIPKVNETYQHILPPTEGFAAIKKDNRWGFVDLQGRLRVANRYDSVLSFTYGTAAFKLRNKWGFLNKEDKIVLQPAYDSLQRFGENYVVVYQRNKAGIINMRGEILLPLRFDCINPWINQHYIIKKDNLLGWANAEGKLLVEPKYEELKPAGKILAAKILGLWGLVDFNGTQKLPAIYSQFEVSADGQYALAAKEIKTEIITIK